MSESKNISSIIIKILNAVKEYRSHSSLDGFLDDERGYKAVLKDLTNSEICVLVWFLEKKYKKSDITSITEINKIFENYSNEHVEFMWNLLI